MALIMSLLTVIIIFIVQITLYYLREHDEKNFFAFLGVRWVIFYFCYWGYQRAVSLSKKTDRAGRGATLQVMFFYVAEEDTQDRYAVIVSPEEEQQETKGESAEKGKVDAKEVASPGE